VLVYIVALVTDNWRSDSLV